VFDRLIATLKTEYQSLMTTLICAVVAGVAGVVGILFVGIAIFVWASNAYGTLQACIAMAGFFLAVALIAIAVLFYARSEAHKRAAKRAEVERREREEAAKNAPPIWMDPSLIPKLLPMLLPIVLKAGQIGIRHRGLLLAALSSADRRLGSAARARYGCRREMPAAEQPAE
jgi:H+/gluconate symporter-like permease